MNRSQVISQIREALYRLAPGIRVILYGSEARRYYLGRSNGLDCSIV